ncbi:MAG: hypothetical protein R3E66_03145 [bacterium]
MKRMIMSLGLFLLLNCAGTNKQLLRPADGEQTEDQKIRVPELWLVTTDHSNNAYFVPFNEFYSQHGFDEEGTLGDLKSYIERLALKVVYLPAGNYVVLFIDSISGQRFSIGFKIDFTGDLQAHKDFTLQNFEVCKASAWHQAFYPWGRAASIADIQTAVEGNHTHTDDLVVSALLRRPNLWTLANRSGLLTEEILSSLLELVDPDARIELLAVELFQARRGTELLTDLNRSGRTFLIPPAAVQGVWQDLPASTRELYYREFIIMTGDIWFTYQSQICLDAPTKLSVYQCPLETCDGRLRGWGRELLSLLEQGPDNPYVRECAKELLTVNSCPEFGVRPLACSSAPVIEREFSAVLDVAKQTEVCKVSYPTNGPEEEFVFGSEFRLVWTTEFTAY